MKILFIGDIVGKSAREKVKESIANLKIKYDYDVIIANGENATGGYGISKKDASDLLSSGLDAITLGNHAWDQREMLSYIEENSKIIRAINYPKGVPGRGEYKFILEDGRSVLVLQVMLRLFMGNSLDDPFETLKKRLKSEILGSTCNSVFVDMHGETTSEKNALAHFLDGSITAIIGTHTHIPTADARILKNGTAYQTDVGMTGDYDTVIGMDKDGPIHGFTKGYRQEGRFVPGNGKGTLCGVFIDSDDNSGLAKKIETFQI